LYEREYYDMARNLLEVVLFEFPNKRSAAFASATNLSGLIYLNMHEPAKALEPFTSAHILRLEIMGPDDSFIAWGYNNLALAYTELGELAEADTNNAMALNMRLRTGSDRIGNSYSNISSLLLRMGKADEAEETLKKCPSLKAFTDATFLATNNPRFSGDMVLLSRIRRNQGRLEEALRLASKALAFRRKLLGNRFKVCDSLYDVADMLQRLGNAASAV
jgi:tetratricopeptide (TPR) repeat protein